MWLVAALLLGLVDGSLGQSQPSSPGSGEQRQTQPGVTQQVPAAVQQPRAPTPVINILPPQKTEQERTQEARERQEKADMDRRLVQFTAALAAYTERLYYATLAVAIATILLVFATAGLMYFGYRQSRDMRAAVDQAKRSADLAERNLTATQRAFVHLRAIVGTPIIDPDGVVRAFKVSPEWENSGVTPTRNLSININWTPHAGGDLPGGFSYAYGASATRLVLGPKAISHAGTINIPPSEIENAKRGAVRIFIWGRAEYSDIFEDTNPHFTQFCFRMDIQTIPGGPDSIGFIHFGGYNLSDEDM
jgi:hypothetical protein